MRDASPQGPADPSGVLRRDAVRDRIDGLHAGRADAPPVRIRRYRFRHTGERSRIRSRVRDPRGEGRRRIGSLQEGRSRAEGDRRPEGELRSPGDSGPVPLRVHRPRALRRPRRMRARRQRRHDRALRQDRRLPGGGRSGHHRPQRDDGRAGGRHQGGARRRRIPQRPNHGVQRQVPISLLRPFQGHRGIGSREGGPRRIPDGMGQQEGGHA